jgi:hypothetical protein
VSDPDAATLFEGAGRQIFERMQAQPGWAELSEVTQAKLRETAEDLGRLLVLKAAGQDVRAELAHAHAQVASLEIATSLRARELLNEVLRITANLLGAFLGGLVRTGL